MSNDFILNAESRDDLGKGASRRLRREAGLVPGIVYGGKKKPVNITVSHKELAKHLENEAFFSHIVSLVIGGKAEDVILKDLQRHPAKAELIHADFMRVSKTKRLSTSVPLHFINASENPNVKLYGGQIHENLMQLEISCLPADLPEFIEVDLSQLEMGQILHISDLQLPKGVSSVALAQGHDHDQPIVSLNKPKGTSSSDDDEGEEADSE
jgi:large subunit ribosomal protein L25